jgi:hypothetical protein
VCLGVKERREGMGTTLPKEPTSKINEIGKCEEKGTR